MPHGEQVTVEIRPRYTTIVGAGMFMTIVLDAKEYRVVPWTDLPKKPTR